MPGFGVEGYDNRLTLSSFVLGQKHIKITTKFLNKTFVVPIEDFPLCKPVFLSTIFILNILLTL